MSSRKVAERASERQKGRADAGAGDSPELHEIIRQTLGNYSSFRAFRNCAPCARSMWSRAQVNHKQVPAIYFAVVRPDGVDCGLSSLFATSLPAATSASSSPRLNRANMMTTITLLDVTVLLRVRATVPQRPESWEVFNDSLQAPSSLRRYPLSRSFVLIVSHFVICSFCVRRRIDEHSQPLCSVSFSVKVPF